MEIIKAVNALKESVSDINTTSQSHKKYYSTIQDVIKDTSLTKGAIVSTLGYYENGDNGGATYLVESERRGTATGSSWSVKMNNGLYANIQNRDYVTYRMFGAKLDGVSDDGPAMRLCHGYAHTIFSLDQTGRIKQYTCTVKQNSGIIYKKDAESISVYTNMDLSGATLLVDDINSTWFGIYVWGDVDSSAFSLEFSEAQKAQLTEGSTHFSMTDNSIPSNVAIQLVETPYSARDDAGYSYTVGRKELLIHDMHGICASPLTSDWTNAGGRDIKCPVTDLKTGTTKIESFTSSFETTFTHIPSQHLTFIGCDVMLNVSTDKYISVLWVKRHNCTVKDFVFRPHRDSLRNPVFKNAMIYLWNSYNVTVQNIQGFNGAGRNNSGNGFTATSGYILRMTNCSDVLVRDCRLLGYWGATAMDNTKNIRFERCQVNRIDSHDYISNLYVEDCVLYQHGLQVGYGTGMLSITNCTQYLEPIQDLSYTNHLLEINTTYGRIFSGKVHIDNIKVVAKRGTPEYAIVQATMWENAVSITEKYAMPEITATNMHIDAENVSELLYISIGGKRKGTTGAEKPTHMKGVAIDNTVRWMYTGRLLTWSSNLAVKVDEVVKVDNKYYKCEGNGGLGTSKPVHTSGSATNGSVSLTYLGTNLKWKSRFGYKMRDFIIIPTSSAYQPKVYKCIQAGTSNGEFPVHTSGTAKDGELTWQYIGSTSSLTKGWNAKTSYSVGDKLLVDGLIYSCTKAGISGSVAPSHKAWFQSASDGSVTWQYVGGDWEPKKWFDKDSYCNARGNLYKVVGPYGSTSGTLPIENNGLSNDGDIIWMDMGNDPTVTWAPGIQLTEGTRVSTPTNLYLVGAGTSGTSNPQFTSGTGVDGTIAIRYVGASSVWQKSKEYKVGDMVHNGNKIYTCIQTGISASTGWGPQMDSGTTTDNTVVWDTVTITGEFRKSSTSYSIGKYIIVADARIYQVIAGTTGTVSPTHTSGSALNGTVNLIWQSVATSSEWKANTRYTKGSQVLSNNRLYTCVSDGTLESSRRLLFDNIDTNIGTVSPIKFKSGTDVRTKLKNNRLEIILRDCHGVSTAPTGIVWFGRSDNPQPTRVVVK